jgi:hypothetical protein
MTLVKLFTDITLINVFIQIYLSLFLIIYIYKFEPFELSRDNWIEIMNESSILLVYYMTIGIFVND